MSKKQLADDSFIDYLISTRSFLSKSKISEDHRAVFYEGGRDSDSFYRERWSHDKIVRSTHGVNCTGSCSWKVYVKDGVITWETQQTDYPSIGAESPEYEPRGCPRGAAFSWYTYSPTRIRYPYIRGFLLDAYRKAKVAVGGDPVDAWAIIIENKEVSKTYKSLRGKGGFVRATWDEALEIVAAAQVHTIKEFGPDRVAGFSPIPAMSMASHAAGARYTSLIGGTMLSFYDWYCDLPIASPQIWGDQTDVPESADWWNASYLIMWGSNIPTTRTPDAHFMTEARYKGQKVVSVSPDYADNTKFADEWLPAQPGTDGALAMAMGHVILKEFYVDKETPEFLDYSKKFTDLPFLVSLTEINGKLTPDRFLTASDLGMEVDSSEWKPLLVDSSSNEVFIPNGTIGDRHTEVGMGKWNLDLEGRDPKLSFYNDGEFHAISLPRFDEKEEIINRGVPTRKIGSHLVTTVYDLILAQYGVGRDGLPGEWPTSYEDATSLYTPAWQEEITSVSAATVERIAREFAQNAKDSGGRSMITLGAGTNHWYHSDTIYRAIISLVLLTGCQGKNGGGWAHYVGQEKARPFTGWAQLAFGADWSRPPRQMAGTSYWYLATDQWRYDAWGAEELTSPLSRGTLSKTSMADTLVKATRMGWTPSFPTFNKNPLTIVKEAKEQGKDPKDYVVQSLKDGSLDFAVADPDNPINFPRVLTVWRANLLGSSGKGNEYFLHHLLGVEGAQSGPETPVEKRPKEMKWHDEAPTGKLDLLVSLDFRMTSTGLFSDILLPAATWYEKYDLSSTDMHPFIHAFNAAINPPWQARTDYDAFMKMSQVFSHLAQKHLGTQSDIVALPLQHDTPTEAAQPFGIVKDWKLGECEPIPGKTMPTLVTVERDYSAIAQKMQTLGPNVENLGTVVKGVTLKQGQAVEYLKNINGVSHEPLTAGRPLLQTAEQACETILALSGVSNGHVAVAGFRELEKRTGQKLADLALDNEGKQITFADTQSRPQGVITSWEWSGSEHGGRRYSPFTINVERLKPWHTLTGRQHFFLDHQWMSELGEQMPIFRPPLNLTTLSNYPKIGAQDELGIAVRYLTPHSKWSIHSEYQDNLFMLALSRGGPDIWMSVEDAEKIGVKDNDWIEAVNRNGVVVARAVVSHRMPEGLVYMYHAKDRTIDVPRVEATGKRGGIHNSLTRLLLKPSHLIGGYAQLSYGFNYYGPTGNQRDEVTVIRRRSQEVTY
ncbi:MAG: nitrate reductase subunit alpha [Candidatus Nanopelagicaceae bacterium]